MAEWHPGFYTFINIPWSSGSPSPPERKGLVLFLDQCLQIYSYDNMKQVQIATALIPKIGSQTKSMVFGKCELPHAFQWRLASELRTTIWIMRFLAVSSLIVLPEPLRKRIPLCMPAAF